MNRADNVSRLLEKRISSEGKQSTNVRKTGVVMMFTAIVPLVFMIACLLWLIPPISSPWVTVGVGAACLAACLTIWNIGKHYTKLSASSRARARQLEDLQLYLISVPEDKWPAKELLSIVFAGRYPFFGDVSHDSLLTSIDTEADES